MQSKAIEWGIAGVILVIALIFTAFKGEKTESAPETLAPEKLPEKTPEIDDAEEARRQIMREMGAKGGRKSKRGPAKKKGEDNEKT